MLNKVTVMGRIVADPELRYTGNNTPVATFRIACDRDFKPREGEKQTDFFTCVAWRSSAEFISKYFAKGRMIVVDGRLQHRQWEDTDGKKRSTVEIVVDSAYFGDSKKEDRGERVESGGSENRAEREVPQSGVFVDVGDDFDGELPF